MSLPNRLKAARLTNASLASGIDDELGNAEKALADILNIPIDTDITAALLRVAAGGLQAIVLQDLGVGDVTAAGEVGRKGAKLRFHDGTAALDVGPDFPSGTVMLFKQATVPVNWTRQVDAANTDAVIIQRTNGEVPAAGGTWTVGGLTHGHTHTLGNHKHETPVADVGGGALINDVTDWPHGTSGISRSTATPGTPQAISRVTYLSGAATPNTSDGASTSVVASDGTWRPKRVDVIVGVKD